MDDVEKVRLKRLAKVENVAAQQTSRPSDKDGESKRKEKEMNKVEEPPPRASQMSRTNPTSTPQITIKPAQSTRSSKAADASEVPFVDWEDECLQNIFEVSLGPSTGRTHLANLSQELATNGDKLPLSLSILDQAIIARVNQVREDVPFDYLVASWGRASRIARTLRSPTDPDKRRVITEAKRLCVSYAEFCVSMPDIFENDKAPIMLYQKLEDASQDDLPIAFIEEWVGKCAEEETLMDVFGPALSRMAWRLNVFKMGEPYTTLLGSLCRLISLKPLAELVTNLPNFSASQSTANRIEIDTFLGPVFRLSPIEQKVAVQYFPNPKETNPASLQSSMQSLRLELRVLHEQMFVIVNTIIRSSPTARDRMLEYFATVLNKNHKLAAMRVDPKSVASDGFMLNIVSVLNRLSEPFMDAAYSKIDKIDGNYFRESTRIDISDETKLNASEQKANEYYAQRLDQAPNFISEVFFLNMACHKYGMVSTLNRFEQISSEVNEMEKHYDRLKLEESSWANNPEGQMMRARFTRLGQQIQTSSSLLVSHEVVLFDNEFQTRSYSFLMLASTWILRMLDPQKAFPQGVLQLPLPLPTPELFSNLPEYFVEILSEFFLFISKYLPRIIGDNPNMELVYLSITFLRSSAYIKNPYLKAKLVEILFYGVMRQRDFPRGVLIDILNSHPFAVENLMPAIMSFYIEVEQTGEHTQFYDKFNIRYHCSQIIKAIWNNPAQRERLADQSRNNPEFFIRFVALLLNDVTYLLDESLSKLGEIHNLQMQLEAGQTGGEGGETRQEQQQTLASSERQATSYMSLGNENVSMFKLFTETIPDSFIISEVVDRLAAMLDYNLNALVGPKCTNLKVKDPQKYRFDPRSLLSDIVQIYLNLRSKPAFILAIARDGRSYKKEMFIRAGDILLRYNVRSSTDIDDLKALVDAIEQAKMEDEQGEEELGEIPDDFLVILPTSRISIDRSTIKSHLLSDSKDPFNREPLALEDVIPDDELRRKIEEFKNQRRGASRMEVE